MSEDKALSPSYILPPEYPGEGNVLAHPVTCLNCGKRMVAEWYDDGVGREFAWEAPEWLCRDCERKVLDAGFEPLYEEACATGNDEEARRLCAIASADMHVGRLVVLDWFGGKLTASDIMDV